ncbi:MAG: hypothetical protein CMM93_06665 [Rickettsiales bacterium]|nr:hypothetical protein [Rickettsiales bacterium]
MPYKYYYACEIKDNSLFYGNTEYDLTEELPNANFIRDFLSIFYLRQSFSYEVNINETEIACFEENTLVKSNKPVVVSNYLSRRLVIVAPKVTIVKSGKLKELNIIADELEILDPLSENCSTRLVGKTRILECSEFYSKKMKFINCDLRNFKSERTVEELTLINCRIRNAKFDEMIEEVYRLSVENTNLTQLNYEFEGNNTLRIENCPYGNYELISNYEEDLKNGAISPNCLMEY